jgi:hypothetical protein
MSVGVWNLNLTKHFTLKTHHQPKFTCLYVVDEEGVNYDFEPIFGKSYGFVLRIHIEKYLNGDFLNVVRVMSIPPKPPKNRTKFQRRLEYLSTT